MFTIVFSLFYSIRQGLRTRTVLQAEVLALRHQLLVLQRSNRSHRLLSRNSMQLMPYVTPGKSKIQQCAASLSPVKLPTYACKRDRSGVIQRPKKMQRIAIDSGFFTQPGSSLSVQELTPQLFVRGNQTVVHSRHHAMRDEHATAPLAL